MVFKDGYEIVTPEEGSLVDSVKPEEISCPFKGHVKVICNPSIIQLDVTKVSNRCGKSTVYACPVRGCPRNVEAPRQQFFPNIYGLKMHYRTVHGEKKIMCSKCSRKFGNLVVYSQHKDKCQQCHYCECGIWYKTRSALLMHAKRKQHKIIGLQPAKVKKSNQESSKSSCIKVSSLPYTPSNTNLSNNHKHQSNIMKLDMHQVSSVSRLIRILPQIAESEPCKTQAEKNDNLNMATISLPKEIVRKLCCIENTTEIQNVKSMKPDSAHVTNLNQSLDSCSPMLQGHTVSKTDHENKRTVNKVKLGKCNKGEILYALSENPSVSLGTSKLNGYIKEAKLKKRWDVQLRKQRGLCKYLDMGKKYEELVEHHSIKKSEDVFNEISVSARNLADTFTQTSSSFKNIEDSCFLKKEGMDMQTQVNSCNFEVAPRKSTMETQTQINFYNFNNGLKSKTDSQTQIDFYDYNGIRKTSCMDTQTPINSSNFNDTLKKLTMDTQTEINSYDFNDIPKKSTMEAQTQMNYCFDPYMSENIQTVESGIQCHLQPYISKCFNDDVFPFIDNETQTETVSSWLSDFTCQDFSNMETQTNFPEAVDTNYNMEPLVLDKSVQLEDMISLNDASNIIQTESSHTSTQTFNVFRDPWLNENLVCESSSTQTDYFENLDFMDIDFHLEKDSLPDNVTRICKDTLISGNVINENTNQIKNNIETQTTISLYDLLDTSLIGNYLSADKHMSNIETQTVASVPEMHERQRSHIETQTENI